MQLFRLANLPHSEYQKVRNRQIRKNMQVFYDEDNYICCDYEELINYKPKKKGRKPKGA